MEHWGSIRNEERYYIEDHRGRMGDLVRLAAAMALWVGSSALVLWALEASF